MKKLIETMKTFKICTMLKIFTLMLLTCSVLLPQAASAARLKDLADVEGVRGNQLFGYGIVTGLNGTGDGKVDFTTKSVANLMEKMGIKVEPQDIKVKNSVSYTHLTLPTIYSV